MFPAISSRIFSSAKCRATHLSSAQLFARNISTTGVRLKTFEPDYLDSSTPLIPTYPPMNIQMKSYNFDLLESYQGYVHKLAENMGIQVTGSWATPSQSYKIYNYMEGSTRIKNEFNLNLYERNVQVDGLRSTDAAILFDIIQATLPQSVELSVHEHNHEHYEERFIPDPFINSIRDELSQGEQELEKEKEKRQEKSAAKAARKQAALLESLQADNEDDD